MTGLSRTMGTRMPVRPWLLVVLGILLLAPLAAGAHSYKLGDLMIGHAWAPPSDGGEAAVYMPILNTGETPDRLVGAASPVAAQVRFRARSEERRVGTEGVGRA